MGLWNKSAELHWRRLCLPTLSESHERHRKPLPPHYYILEMRKIPLKRWAKSYGVPLVAGAVLLGAIAAQSRLVNRDLEWIEETKFSYLPEIKTARLLTPGHQITAGRLWWIRAATYFGGETLAGRQALWMLQLSGLAAKLDPQFRWPYLVIGTSATDDEGDRDIELLRLGIENLPNDFQLHLFLAMRLVEKHADFDGAVAVLDRVLKLPETPDFMHGMRETYQKNANDLPQALAIYLGEWERVKAAPQMALAVLNRANRMVVAKKNAHSTLTLKEMKGWGEMLQAGTITPEQYYSAALSLALPNPPPSSAEGDSE